MANVDYGGSGRGPGGGLFAVRGVADRVAVGTGEAAVELHADEFGAGGAAAVPCSQDPRQPVRVELPLLVRCPLESKESRRRSAGVKTATLQRPVPTVLAPAVGASPHGGAEYMDGTRSRALQHQTGEPNAAESRVSFEAPFGELLQIRMGRTRPLHTGGLTGTAVRSARRLSRLRTRFSARPSG